MHLRSIAIKGFKSFPTRTKLDFGPGVSVIVGPNGSGKSNITDAVLWALGEQSPLAVRGQTMKDVIFAGGHGVAGSGAAEVEVVIDNGDRRLDSEFSDIAIVRRLGRDGEGEYRLNGARCRLVDVLEVLSDSGLGKEMHSVVSQGKVEQIVLSRPRERRLLIEEAAGLGKHRKRRRRAQLKLERTGENLSRALDVEREARSRLRPLKRQAEAAELHERIERQSLEARFALARDAARAALAGLAASEARAAAARGERDESERLLGEVARRREEAELAFAAQAREREQLQARVFSASSAGERISMRLERARDQARAAAERRARRLRQLELLERELRREAAARAEPPADGALPHPPAGPEGRAAWEALAPADRVRSLERELAQLESEREASLRKELSSLEAELEPARALLVRTRDAAGRERQGLEDAEAAAEAARAERRECERAGEAARRRAAELGAQLAAVNQFLRSASGAPGGAPSLADALEVDAGYELALAAALGPALGAGLVEDLGAGQALLDAAGPQGGDALVAGLARGRAPGGPPPVAGAERLLERVRGRGQQAALAERLLGGVWVVDSLERVASSFDGVAVTRSGRVLHAGRGTLSQAPLGGSERLLEERRRRDELVAASASAAAAESAAATELERASERVAAADSAREGAEAALRRAVRSVDEATDALRRAEWLIARRREAPDEGPGAVRRAELGADLRAELRLAERAEREHGERLRAAERLRGGIEQDAALAEHSERAAVALAAAGEAVAGRRDALAGELALRAAGGEQTAAALRACAHEESELQARLKRASDALTVAEVEAQGVRDAAAGTERELAELAGRLGLEARPADGELPAHERQELQTRVERLARRREQLGPVNPLAREEYEEAVAHVEELESQRRDLESALAELEGLIRDTDRRIRESFEETFEAAARNFEELIQHLFPGGRGRLRLVAPDQVLRPVVGGEPAPDAPAAEAEAAGHDEQPEAGVEIEVTPPGKSTKRLSLLSGGEKSLVALAFMFAVFLARPCPFYILDEVEAALDDVNIDRFLELVRRYADRAQFIVVTHQKRTMEAADTLYGVSMGGDGVSRVVSRKLAGEPGEQGRLGERPAA